jgi:hypothetical protein
MLPDPALLRAARALTARGWLVFPCAPGGKRPALRGDWQDLATTSPAQVRAWWTRAPYNIGIACGPSRLVVIDLDMPRPEQHQGQAEHGPDALAALCGRHGQPYPLPTYAVDTPSGGCHLYYAAPGGPGERVRNSAGRLGTLIDVRADGGYVIGAGSRIGGRVYTVCDERPPVPLPGWIADLLRSEPPPGSAVNWRNPVSNSAQGTAYAMAALREEARLVAAAKPGTRNDTLNRAAFSLGQLIAADLLSHLAVIKALAGAAERAGLPAGEARRTIRSGITAGMRRPRQPARRAGCRAPGGR